MTATEAVETSVTTTNGLSQDYTNLDDHISQTSIDTPRFKPFTLITNVIVNIACLLLELYRKLYLSSPQRFFRRLEIVGDVSNRHQTIPTSPTISKRASAEGEGEGTRLLIGAQNMLLLNYQAASQRNK